MRKEICQFAGMEISFAHSLFALLLKIAQIKERPMSNDHEQFALIAHDKKQR